MVPVLSLLLCLGLLCSGASFDASFKAGLTALQRGDLGEAHKELENARAISPRDGRVWVALSQVYWREHDNVAAERAAGEAAALGPGDPAVLRGLAIYYTESDQSLKAAEAEAKYAAKMPADTDARARAIESYFESARPLLEAQKFAAAAAILEKANALLPKSEQLELALGVTYYGLRRFDDAADAFLQTIEIAPETEQPYMFLGKILDQIPSRLARVTRRFEQYETAHPASPAGYLLHAKALDAQSLDPELAARLLRRSLDLNANDASAHFEMGNVLDRMSRYSDAVAEFARAAELSPSDPAPHYRLARDYDRIGKPDDANAERAKHAQLVSALEASR